MPPAGDGRLSFKEFAEAEEDPEEVTLFTLSGGRGGHRWIGGWLSEEPTEVEGSYYRVYHRWLRLRVSKVSLINLSWMDAGGKKRTAWIGKRLEKPERAGLDSGAAPVGTFVFICSVFSLVEGVLAPWDREKCWPTNEDFSETKSGSCSLIAIQFLVGSPKGPGPSESDVLWPQRPFSGSIFISKTVR